MFHNDTMVSGEKSQSGDLAAEQRRWCGSCRYCCSITVISRTWCNFTRQPTRSSIVSLPESVTNLLKWFIVTKSFTEQDHYTANILHVVVLENIITSSTTSATLSFYCIHDPTTIWYIIVCSKTDGKPA